MVEISKSRPKNRDDEVYALRAFLWCLCENGLYSENFWMLLAVLRCRDHHVVDVCHQRKYHVCLKALTKKRDFAAMSLAAVSGLRAGDIASLKLDDIDWKRKEIRIVQGKPMAPLFCLSPYQCCRRLGRPQTDARNTFIHHQADESYKAIYFRRPAGHAQLYAWL